MQINTIPKVRPMDVGIHLFKKQDVLSQEEDQNHRLMELKRGASMGNLFKEKTKIIFENLAGEIIQTEATIWAVTEKNVVLKGDRTIPIRSIRKVIV